MPITLELHVGANDQPHHLARVLPLATDHMAKMILQTLFRERTAAVTALGARALCGTLSLPRRLLDGGALLDGGDVLLGTSSPAHGSDGGTRARLGSKSGTLGGDATVGDRDAGLGSRTKTRGSSYHGASPWAASRRGSGGLLGRVVDERFGLGGMKSGLRLGVSNIQLERRGGSGLGRAAAASLLQTGTSFCAKRFGVDGDGRDEGGLGHGVHLPRNALAGDECLGNTGRKGLGTRLLQSQVEDWPSTLGDAEGQIEGRIRGQGRRAGTHVEGGAAISKGLGKIIGDQGQVTKGREGVGVGHGGTRGGANFWPCHHVISCRFRFFVGGNSAVPAASSPLSRARSELILLILLEDTTGV